MTELVNQTNLAEYEAFVQSHPKGHFAQSSLWAKQKPAWTWQAILCRGEDGKIKGSVAFLIRKMPIVRKKMMYACRGPVCDLTDRATFEELMEVFDKKDLSLKENQEEFVKKCMSLTMECIKAHIFVATEYEEPIQRKEMRMECSQS